MPNFQAALPRLKAIFLDVDNTLLDFDAYVQETMRVGFDKFGLIPYEPRMFGTFTEINESLWRRIERKEITFDQLKAVRWNQVFAALDIVSDGPAFETYFREALNESAIPVPGAPALLEKLSARYILCAATNGPTRQQHHRLELAGMDRHLSHVFVSEAFGVSKPAPAFFDAAFAELNAARPDGAPAIQPEEALMVGDSLTSDIAGGQNAGMWTCYFDRGRHTEVKGSAQPDVVVTSLAAIGTLLDGASDAR